MVMMSYTAKDQGQLMQWKQMNTTDSSILAANEVGKCAYIDSTVNSTFTSAACN